MLHFELLPNFTITIIKDRKLKTEELQDVTQTYGLANYKKLSSIRSQTFLTYYT